MKEMKEMEMEVRQNKAKGILKRCTLFGIMAVMALSVTACGGKKNKSAEGARPKTEASQSKNQSSRKKDDKKADTSAKKDDKKADTSAKKNDQKKDDAQPVENPGSVDAGKGDVKSTQNQENAGAEKKDEKKDDKKSDKKNEKKDDKKSDSKKDSGADKTQKSDKKTTKK